MSTDPVTFEEEDAEFVGRNKARFRRRLRERWICEAPDHNHCYSNTDGAHVPFSEEEMEIWVTALHNGEATLLIPPPSILPPKASTSEDAESVLSWASNRTTHYQRSFQWQSNLSLTDFRSMQMRLSSSTASSSNSVFSSSTASSGVPGIGHLSGKAVKWVGSQILNSLVPLEIRRRRWVIRQIIKKLGQVPMNDRAEWVVKRGKKINRALDDLLELSLENYRPNWRETAVRQGVLIEDLVLVGIFKEDVETSTTLNSINIKVLPLRLLRESASEDLADHLRETLLQDSPEITDEEPLIAEITAMLCFELAYGTSALWSHGGFITLNGLYETPSGKHNLQKLGQRGALMQDLARRTFDASADLTSSDHCQAIQFFTAYANDVPTFRSYLSEPTGIPLLVQNIKTQDGLREICTVLSVISSFDWCISVLIPLNICDVVVQTLVTAQRPVDPHQPPPHCWIAYSLLRMLYKIAIYGNGSGRMCVSTATTNELRQLLPRIKDNIQGRFGDSMAQQADGWIKQTWPHEYMSIMTKR